MEIFLYIYRKGQVSEPIVSNIVGLMLGFTFNIYFLNDLEHRFYLNKIAFYVKVIQRLIIRAVGIVIMAIFLKSMSYYLVGFTD